MDIEDAKLRLLMVIHARLGFHKLHILILQQQVLIQDKELMGHITTAEIQMKILKFGVIQLIQV